MYFHGTRLIYNDPWVESHLWPQQPWGQRSSRVNDLFLNLTGGVKSNITMIAQVCDRERRRDSWFENCLRKGIPNLQKVSVNKLAKPYFGKKKFMTPHHWCTLLPTQASIVLNSVFLNNINELSEVTFWLSALWSSKISWPPPIFLSNNLWPIPSILGTTLPLRRKWQAQNFKEFHCLWMLKQLHGYSNR